MQFENYDAKKTLHLNVQLLQLKFSVSVNKIFIPRVFPHYFSMTKSLEYILKVKYRTQYWDVSTSVIRRYNKYKHTKLFLMLLFVHSIIPHIFSSCVNSLQAQADFEKMSGCQPTALQEHWLRAASSVEQLSERLPSEHIPRLSFCRHPPLSLTRSNNRGR